jgi:cation diffusion facilitator family transporter
MEIKVNLMIWLSMLSNIFLTFVKIIVGVLFQSQVLIADGIHNAGDVMASIAAITSIKIARKPADNDHPYGHGKAEVLASSFVALILGASALFIAYEAIKTLVTGEISEAHVVAFMAACVSLILKQVLYVYSMRIGKKANSKSLMATAYDHLADVYASLAAVVGIGVGLLGKHYHLPLLDYGDPISGLIVAFLVVKLSWKIAKESIETLMETSLDQEQMEFYTSIIEMIPKVKRIDRIRAREHGYYIIMDVRVAIPAGLSIQEGHDISRRIKHSIMKKDSNVKEVLVHLNPWYEDQADEPPHQMNQIHKGKVASM